MGAIGLIDGTTYEGNNKMHIIVITFLILLLWALSWKRYYKDGRTPFIHSWNWWRNNHFFSRWESIVMTLRSDIIRPLNNTYLWIRRKIRYQWSKLPWSKMYKLKKRIKELEAKLAESARINET